jgi:flagellar hook-basal body complex protein FliE
MDPIGLDASQYLASLEEWRSSISSPRISGTGDLPALDESSIGRAVAPAFEDVLKGFLSKVDGSQHRADAMVESLALGEPVDVHPVMLALGEASNALQLTLQVRGKLLEAYQELMRLQL